MILFLSLLARAGHGKSTVAKYLTDKYGAKTISLATPLKKCAQACMGFSDAQLWGTQAEKEAVDPRYGFSCRQFLQKLGTEGMRKEFGEDVHLDALVRRANEIAEAEHLVPRGLFIVDDARFRNEVKYLNSLGVSRGPHYMRGATLKIVCTDAPPPPPEIADHPSEREIDEVPESDLAATIVSSRAQGVSHLCAEVEEVLSKVPALVAFKVLL
jgi:hypothetical protein